MATNMEPARHKNHTGLGWLILGLALVAISVFFIALGTHQDAGTASPVWFLAIIGAVITIFGLIAMTKRRYPGQV